MGTYIRTPIQTCDQLLEFASRSRRTCMWCSGFMHEREVDFPPSIPGRRGLGMEERFVAGGVEIGWSMYSLCGVPSLSKMMSWAPR